MIKDTMSGATASYAWRELRDEAVASAVRRPRMAWMVLWLVACLAALWGGGWSSWRIADEGVGVLGVNHGVPWGMDIVHFVFWIGLGHAGTLISAVLLLTGQHWRNPIARSAELMTLCAVVCAAVFPVVHVGRVWMAWMASPLPDTSGVWPDLSSPLMWDVLAVSSYLTLSALYWWIGAAPDFAVMRDNCSCHWLKKLYGFLALGWQGTSRQWTVYERVSVLLAVVLTPLVVSVHSVVSFDFAATQTHGWHETMFPPYFVAGAILSGLAMVQLIIFGGQCWLPEQTALFLRREAMDKSSRLLLGMSCVMGAMYFWETMSAALTGGEAWNSMKDRLVDWPFWAMVIGNVVLPQVYWVKQLRGKGWCVVPIACCILAGMWSERWLIVVNSLEHGGSAALNSTYAPTDVDWAMGIGAVGLFLALFLAVSKVAPFFSLADMGNSLLCHQQERRKP